MNENELKGAQAVFKSLCEMLDEHKFRYEKNEEDLSIKCMTQGDDLPINLHIDVDAKRQLILCRKCHLLLQKTVELRWLLP